MKTVIDFDRLESGQTRQLCLHLYERAEALLRTNVTLLRRLGSDENTTPDDHIRILNDWSIIQEQLIMASDEEIMKIVGARNSMN